MDDLETQLPSALSELAEHVEVTPRLDRIVRDRALARRRRRRLAQAATAFSLIVVVAVGTAALVIWARSTTTGNPNVETRHGSGTAQRLASRMPARIVVVTTDGRVVLVSSHTGRELRTLATGADRKTTLDVTPDGGRVFFDRPTQSNTDCLQVQEVAGVAREIVSARTTGGPVALVAAAATEPALSPDGKTLAFLNYQGPSYQGPSGCLRPQSLVLKQTKDLANTALFGPGWTVRDPAESLAGLSWAPDSRHLVFGLVNGPGNGYPRLLDTATPGTPLESAPENQKYLGNQYLGDTGDMFGVDGTAGEQPLRVVTIDPANGRVRRTLFKLATPCCGATLSADSSGRHILVVTSGVTDPASPRLYRWSRGQRKPKEIAARVTAAAWAP